MTKRPSLASSMKALEEPAPDPLARPVKPAAGTRVGMKRLLTPVEPALHKRLKILAVQQDTTLEALTRVALEAYLLQHDSK